MSRPTILFVDDEPIIRRTLPVILEKHGYEVTTASSPSEALAIIGAKKFDVLISDLNIGEAGDGFTVLSAVRRTHPETRTLLLTGYPDFTAALEAIRQQVDDFLVKPTQIPDMLDKVARLLSRSTLHKDAKLGKRLWQLMQEDKEKILAEWLRKAEQDSQLSLRPMPASERLEPLSGRLDELIEVLQSCNTAETITQLISARLHGKTRRSQDYSIGMLVEEVHISSGSTYCTRNLETLRTRSH